MNGFNLVKIDLDGNVVLDNGFSVNAAGFTIHSAVHMARRVNVMHLHTDGEVAVSSMKEGLHHSPNTRCSYTTFVYDWEGVALDLDEEVVADLGTKNLAPQKSWNIGTWQQRWLVFMRIYYLERACRFR